MAYKRLPCRWCGRSLDDKHKAKRYCSDECQDEMIASRKAEPHAKPTYEIPEKYLVRGPVTYSAGNSTIINGE